MITAFIIFVITYIFIGLRQIPRMLIGPVANLIVARQAGRTVEIGFLEYFRVGALITIITIGAGILVLALEVKIARGEQAAGVRSEKTVPPVAPGLTGSWSDEGPAAVISDTQKTVTVIPAGEAARERTYRVVLLCDTMESRTRGLQGFRKLKRDEAALFVFDKPEPVMFWMGTVDFPIDIIFVAGNGNVAAVYPDREPEDRSFFPSRLPVRWAVETAAGSGVKVGDRVKLSAE